MFLKWGQKFNQNLINNQTQAESKFSANSVISAESTWLLLSGPSCYMIVLLYDMKLNYLVWHDWAIALCIVLSSVFSSINTKIQSFKFSNFSNFQSLQLHLHFDYWRRKDDIAFSAMIYSRAMFIFGEKVLFKLIFAFFLFLYETLFFRQWSQNLQYERDR